MTEAALRPEQDCCMGEGCTCDQISADICKSEPLPTSEKPGAWLKFGRSCTKSLPGTISVTSRLDSSGSLELIDALLACIGWLYCCLEGLALPASSHAPRSQAAFLQ